MRPPITLPNYFTSAEVAARYAKSRPFFHAEVAERVRRFAGVQGFGRVLDVGCGSGQSAVALASIAREVIAIDASEEMLRYATRLPNIHYQVGFAEQLDNLEDFDLVSVGSALHWFNRERFYAQCRKVLRPSGLLAVYNDHFTAHMEGSVECKRWMRTRFAKRFPPPQRGMRDIDELQAAACGFAVCERSWFSHRVPFSRAELIAYLLTRSNILAVLTSEKGSGKQEQHTVVEWLQRELAPLLPDGVTGCFIFKCNLWLLRSS